MSALEKVLALAGVPLEPVVFPCDGEELLLAARASLDAAFLMLASDPDNDGDDDSSAAGDTDNDADHTGHTLFKKLRGKLGDKAAAKMCAKADSKKVAATMVGQAIACLELSVTQAERDSAKDSGNSLPDGSYPINNTKQLHSAAVLAASKHGDWKGARTLIRRRARELGVDVKSLPGFGESDGGDSKNVSASMIMLAARPSSEMDHLPVLDRSGVMDHGPFSGAHAHAHMVPSAHAHQHFHNNDSHHAHVH